MPSTPRPCPPRRCLALAVLLALPALAPAAEDDAAAQCPIGVLKCPKKPVDWGMCGKNDLLDFYVPGLPVEGDRNSVERTINALKVSSPDKNHYTLEGKAEIRQLDLFVHAQKITYDTETTDFTAEGPVTYQDRSLLMSATSARGNTDLDRCTLDGARYQLIEARGNGIAQVVVMDDPDHATLTAATYSTCNPGDQQWAFAARELEIDRAEGVGRGHGVTLRIHNVPVFWFPYIRFALDDRRESGFLYPDIGYSNRRGFDFSLPYFPAEQVIITSADAKIGSLADLKKSQVAVVNSTAGDIVVSEELGKSSTAIHRFDNTVLMLEELYRGGVDAKRLVFIDETWVKTNMAPLRGWGPRGRRLKAKVPHRRWKTMTFIAALRHDRVDAPWLIDGPVNGERFRLYVEQVLPALG